MVSGSKTELTKELEAFIDDNEDYIGPKLHEQLVGIYEQLNNDATDLDAELEEAKEDIKKLESEVDRLGDAAE
ncbi:hypothetical protein EV207_101141 [Scopulibacillus darangshiensis]|uniref:Uncharacterized protein n=1 Tax=Scopulibacillus darangshiensis TaxID=442528 RepID=A0A4R2PAQ1_9BACL|nr:hypothetical protein [Scopulibacillus darangshiensis]TCP32163.1 hypothetical protein EV207_101141 [Scopulibacillus darangshiensis]